MRQMVVVQDCIEDEGVGSDGLTAINGIIAEEQDVALAEVRVNNDGVFRDRSAFIEKAIEKEALVFGEAQNHFRTQFGWNY